MKHKTHHFYNCDQHLLLIKIGIVFTSQYCQSQIQKFSKYVSARVGDARLIGPSYYLTASFMRKSHRAQMQMDLLGCKQLCG